jgi:hypothetical protein
VLQNSLQKAWDLTEKEGYQSEELIPKDPELDAILKMQEKAEEEQPLTDREKYLVEAVKKEQQKFDKEQREAVGKALADKIEIV